MVTEKDQVRIVFGGEKQCYAGKNSSEYFAEGVQCWYDTNRTMDHDHNHIHTRAQLKKYDTALGQLCEDVLGDSKWRFISPPESVRGVLTRRGGGLDPEVVSQLNAGNEKVFR